MKTLLITTCLLFVTKTGICFDSKQATAALEAQPGIVQLDSARAQQRLQVTKTFDDGTQADVSHRATFESAVPSVAVASKSGVIIAKGNGTTKMLVKYAGRTARVHVTVSNFETRKPIDFRTEAIGALSRGGCNSGACHGSPNGKNGFRLSLRGFDPDVDYQQLTRDLFGRRVNSGEPDASLMLLKASGGVAHQGGLRFKKHEVAFQTLRQWIAEGCLDSAPKPMTRLEVLPERRVLHTQHRTQQIVVRAHFADGSQQDVTDLSVFTSANDELASVTRSGFVEFHETAEVAILVRFLDRIETVRLTWIRHDPSFRFPKTPENNFVDKHVFEKQKTLQLVPAKLVNDAVFLRRVHLDLIGALPTPQQAVEFLDSKDAQKREKLVDRLLERDEYAEFWAMKWADVMRGNRETISERGVHNFHRYLKTVLREDRPFDQVARHILTSLGNTIHEPAANFYRVSRTPNEAAESFSQLFLGVRIQCAKCHNHPYESITQNDYYGLSAYFSRVRIKGTRFGLDDEIVHLARTGEVKFPNSDRVIEPMAFGVSAGKLTEKDDPRARLADWLTTEKKRFFARSVMNRVWFHLVGQGIVDPVDDFRDSNLPSNPALLNALADEFVKHKYHFKPVIRTILNSRTYQLSAQQPAQQSEFSANPSRYFTKSVVRMLDAEQLLDAISMATGIPEKFPGYPLGTRAISLAEGNIKHRFLQAFTKPIRDVACECARETDPSMSQVVHLMNNGGLLDKVESSSSRLGKWIAAGKTNDEVVELLYLATLSRRPTPKENALASGYVQESPNRKQGLQDLQHVLIMSNEFLLRH
jgi:hypothetical protein